VAGGFVPIPLKRQDDPGLPPDVSAETRVESHGTGGVLKKDVPAQHVLHLTNKHVRNRHFEVNSSVEDPEVTFAGGVSSWKRSETVSGRLKKPITVTRSNALHHPGECAPNNGHAILLEVDVTALFPGEAVVSTNEPFAYQFECEC